MRSRPSSPLLQSDLAPLIALPSEPLTPHAPVDTNAERRRYCAPDMAFRHPMSVIEPAPDSRAVLLGILDWYRLLSPVRVRVDRVAYVAEAQTAFVDATQVFCVRWSPFGAAAARCVLCSFSFVLGSDPRASPQLHCPSHSMFPSDPHPFLAIGHSTHPRTHTHTPTHTQPYPHPH